MVKKVKKSEEKTKSDKQVVEEVTKKLLELMGTKAEISVVEDKDNNAILIDIEGKDEAGLIIGNRGSTLLAIQTIIGMIVRNKIGDWRRIIVDVADWREKEEERLKILAYEAVERAKTTGEAQNLYNLSASQRRVIHLTLSDDPSVKTESQGEGKDRYLVISAK